MPTPRDGGGVGAGVSWSTCSGALYAHLRPQEADEVFVGACSDSRWGVQVTLEAF